MVSKESVELFEQVAFWIYEICLWPVAIFLIYHIINFVVSPIALYFRYHNNQSENIKRFIYSPSITPVTFIVPAWNEGHHIVSHVRGLLKLSGHSKRVIVINDGSTDDTLEKLITAYDLYPLPPVIPQKIQTQTIHSYYRSKNYPKLLVIDKKNGGKSDALNAGLNLCETELIVQTDADTFIENEGFQRALFSFLVRKNSVALGSSFSILNHCHISGGRMKEINYPNKYLAQVQTIEYMRSFCNFRAGTAFIGGVPVIAGAFGIYDKGLLLDINGFSTNCLTEDLDLTLKIHQHCRKNKRPYAIDYIPSTCAWTLVPTKWNALFVQRERWQRGTLDSFWKYKSLLLNPTYGRIGLIGLPVLLLETLTVLIEFLCFLLIPLFWYFGLLHWDFVVRLLLFSLTFLLFSSTLAVMTEEITFRRYPSLSNVFRMFWSTVIENFGARQWILLARLQAFVRVFFRDRTWRCARGEVHK